MPTKLPQAEENENHVSMSEGREHVVQIKRLPGRPIHEVEKTTDQYANAANSREFLREDVYVKYPSKRDVQPRRGTQIGASLFQEVGRQKRVTSILEVSAPRVSDPHSNANRATATIFNKPPGPDVTEIVESEDETRIIDSYHSETKSYKELKAKKHVLERNELDQSGMRYSNIFVPELTRKYKNKRMPWRHRNSGRVGKAAVPCNCNAENGSTQYLCKYCYSSMSLNELKSSSRDQTTSRQPEFTCSMDNLPNHHHHHRHYHNHRGQPRGTDDHRRFIHSYSIDSMPRRMYSSDAIHELYASNSILNRNADLLEIEYEEALNSRDEGSDTFLTPEKLQLINKLASDIVLEEENDLDKASKTLKLALDKRFGVRWHVVIGNVTYGSNVAILPGTLVNFKIGRNVILAWQT